MCGVFISSLFRARGMDYNRGAGTLSSERTERRGGVPGSAYAGPRRVLGTVFQPQRTAGNSDFLFRFSGMASCGSAVKREHVQKIRGFSFASENSPPSGHIESEWISRRLQYAEK